jgi:hypothetical protein
MTVDLDALEKPTALDFMVMMHPIVTAAKAAGVPFRLTMDGGRLSLIIIASELAKAQGGE